MTVRHASNKLVRHRTTFRSHNHRYLHDWSSFFWDSPKLCTGHCCISMLWLLREVVMDTWTRLAVEVALKQPVRTRRTNENPNYSFHVQYLGLSILHWWFKKQTNKKK